MELIKAKRFEEVYSRLPDSSRGLPRAVPIFLAP